MAQDTIILSAGSQRTERVAGRFFTVLSATAKFIVELDGRRREVRVGDRISGEGFKRISFFETEGVSNTIVYDAGDEEYQGEVQVSGISNETFDYPYLMTADGDPLAIAGNTGSFTSLPASLSISGVNYQRKSFHIANRTGNDLGIYESSTGKLMDILNANTDRTFFFSQAVKIRGTNSNLTVSLYYTLYISQPI